MNPEQEKSRRDIIYKNIKEIEEDYRHRLKTRTLSDINGTFYQMCLESNLIGINQSKSGWFKYKVDHVNNKWIVDLCQKGSVYPDMIILFRFNGSKELQSVMGRSTSVKLIARKHIMEDPPAGAETGKVYKKLDTLVNLWEINGDTMVSPFKFGGNLPLIIVGHNLFLESPTEFSVEYYGKIIPNEKRMRLFDRKYHRLNEKGEHVLLAGGKVSVSDNRYGIDLSLIEKEEEQRYRSLYKQCVDS